MFDELTNPENAQRGHYSPTTGCPGARCCGSARWAPQAPRWWRQAQFGAPYLAQKGLLSTDGAFAATATALGDLLFYKEEFPTSPLILDAVQRPAADPEGAGAGEDARGRRLGRSRPGPASASRTRCATSATRSGPATCGSPDPIVYKIDAQGRRPTRSPPRRCCRSTRWASRRVSFDATGKTVRRRRQADAAGQHDLRLQRHLPGSDDQRRVRQAGAGPLRNHLDENPLGPRPAGLRLARLVVPDPPAQRAHRAGERRQPALLHDVTARSTRATCPASGSTTCT